MPQLDHVCRPIQAEAYEIALTELKQLRPDALNDENVIDVVMAAVLDLANAGQTNPEALARYAVGRALATVQNDRQ